MATVINRVTATTNNDKPPRTAAARRFNRQQRLLDAAAYSRVFKKARRSKDRYFTVLWRDSDRQQARLGLAISKKNCRLAVQRNRLKRLIRESFRQHQHELAGFDFVVLNQASTHLAGNAELLDSLAGHWRSSQRKAQQPAQRKQS